MATTSKRVAELSATLQPITSFGIDMITGEMYGEAEDYCSYNASFYCDGWIKPVFDGSFKGAILQSVEEFQVIRLYHVDTYMEGLAHDEIPEDWDDENAPDFPELEFKGCKEIQQIWFDHQGNMEILHIDKDIMKIPNDMYYFEHSEESYLVHVVGLQSWCYEPKFSNIITNAVNERTDYCYDCYDGNPLSWRLSNARQYLSIAEPMFLQLVEDNNMWKYAKDIKHIFKIAHRHHWQFPTDRGMARLWFDYLTMLERNGKDTHNPLLICPNLDNLAEEHNKLVEELNARMAERRRVEEIERAERERKMIEERESEFAVNHAPLLGFMFDNGHFNFKSLDSVEEYRVEGDIMHHCIFHSEYYEDDNLLAMHISDLEGNRVATCTIDVVKGEIDQIQPMCDDVGFYKTYGIVWQTTDDYNEIWNTLMARMHIIQKQVRENKKALHKENNNTNTLIQIAV